MSEMYDHGPIDDEDQLQAEDTLLDRGVDDVLDEGYSPPDRIPASHRYGFTAAEEHAGETLDQRIGQEEPDDAYRDEDDDEAPLAYDLGIDGAGASAEEAAMHIEGDIPE